MSRRYSCRYGTKNVSLKTPIDEPIMKKSRLISLMIGVLSLACLSARCKGPEANDLERELIEPEKELVTYFKNQIEKASPDRAPLELYKQTLDDASVEAAKERLWALWKEANQERLKRFDLLQAPAVIEWSLPESEVMKVDLFTKGEKPAEGYPFIINLHGGGQDPNASHAWGAAFNDREWEAARTLGKRYKDAPSYYFVPRMADDRKGRWYLAPQRTAWLRAWQLSVLSGIANPDKVYMMGISEGGYGSHRLAMFFPDYFAGFGPMAAAEPMGRYIQNLRNTAIRLEVGEKDEGFGRNRFASEWQRALDSLRQESPNDFNHKVVIQAGRGHGIDYYNVSPWLVQQTRKHYPEHLTCLYYNLMDGYRNGFYYLRLDGLSKDGELMIEVKKEGNRYEVTTEEVKGHVTGTLGLYVDRVDFEKPVQVVVNGKELFDQKVGRSLGVMAESLALFGDPARLFSAKVEIAL